MDRLRYEIRLMGWSVVLTPLLIVIVMAGLATLTDFLVGDPPRIMSAALEVMLPLATGVLVGMIASRDYALELQLTMPRLYHQTAMLRILLILGWTASIALVTSSILIASNLVFLPDQLAALPSVTSLLANQLTWIAPLFWFMGVGLCLALLFRNPTAPGGLLAALWIADLLLYSLFATNDWLKLLHLFATTTTPMIDFWWTNRLVMLGTGLAGLGMGWLILRNTEGLLKGASEE